MPRSRTAAKLAIAAFVVWLVPFAPSPATSADLTLRIAGGGPATLRPGNLLGDLARDQFDSLTNGRINLDTQLTGKLCSEYECVEAARRRATDLAVLSCSDMGAFGLTLTLLELPFIFRNSEAAETIINDWLMHNLRTSMRENERLQLLAVFPIGKSKGLATTSGPVRIPDELLERSIRVSKSPAEFSLLHAWGATAVPVDWPRVSAGFKHETAEGLYVSASTLLAVDLYPRITHFTKTGGIWDCGVLVMDPSRYDRLPSWAKQAADEAGSSLQTEIFASELTRSADEQEALESKDVEVYEPTEKETSLWRQATTKAWRQLAGTFDPGDAERTLADQDLQDMIALLKKVGAL